MSVFSNIIKELVERRLWPIAAGLLVALVAVPVLLAKPADEGTSSATPTTTDALAGDSAKLLGEIKPAVTLGGEGGFRKHVNRLPRKNPFIQQARPKASQSDGLTLPSADTGSPTTDLTGGDTGTIPPTTYTPPATEQPQQFNYTANVRFGKIGDTDSKTILPTRALPSTSNPIVIFMGASGGGDQAVFVVATGVTARGDGDCKPSTTKCSFVYMSPSDVQFFEVAEGETVTTYELELESIGTKSASETTGTSPKSRHGSQNTGSSPSAQEIKRARDALRSKRVFKALDLLGF